MLTPVDLVAGLWLSLLCTGSGPCQLTAPPGAFAEGRDAVALRDGRTPSPLDMSVDELTRRVEANPGTLGSLSIGAPGSAVLFNAVELPAGPWWEKAPGADWWATAETVTAIRTAIGTVQELFPGTQPIVIGDISRRDGGRIARHESHQGGRDVDFGFYYQSGAVAWWAGATASNLDLPRNWALVRALVVRTDVEVVFLDTRVQRLLYRHAQTIGEDQEWLDRVFQFSRGSRDAIIQHLPNHRTHYHVRFYNPVAQELGRRAHPLLVQFEVMQPPVYTVKHVARQGQTLGHIAARYGVSVRAIMQANGLTSTQIRAGRAYRVPLRTPAPPPDPVTVPRRALPPDTPPAVGGVDWPSAESLYGTASAR